MEWIKVSERLPDEGKTVLCYAPQFRWDIVMGQLADRKMGHWERPGTGTAINVTHWMPLPNAPRGDA